MSRIFDPATGGENRCSECGTRYAAPYAHPRAGPSCPWCFTPHKFPRRRRPDNAPLGLKGEYRRFTAGHPGTPLGHGMPLGRTLRLDGESHRMAWMRLLRADPCAYCGLLPAGTVDHITPKSMPGKALYGAHDWLNMTGACEPCNSNKAVRTLLDFLWTRSGRKLSDGANIVRSTKVQEELAA